jgi:hypothetical protein
VLDINDQLTNYWVQLDEAFPEITVEELGRDEAAVRITRMPILRHRPVLVALAAAAVLVVVLAAVVLLDPFGADEPPFITDPTTTTVPAPTTTEAAPTTTQAVTTTVADPAVELPVITWELITDEALDPPGSVRLSDVVAAGPGLIAVGDIWSDEEELSIGAIWYSTDGRTWSRVAHDDQAFSNTAILAIAEGGPGIVAVGYAFNEDYPDEETAAAVWVSEDGISWSRVPHSEEVFGGPGMQDMKDVVAGGPGLVAVGWDDPEGRDSTAAVWTSSDGFTWQRVPHVESVFGGARMQVMSSIATDGTLLVATGHDGLWSGSGGSDQPAAVWTSPDGLTWSRVPPQDSLTSGQDGNGDWAWMQEVIAGGPGFVGFGRIGWCRTGCDEAGAAWTSADGVAWERSEVEEARGIPYSFGYGVIEFDDVLVGVGRGFDPFGGSGPAVVWVSVDGGETWIRQPHSGAQYGKVNEGPVTMWKVTELGSQLVAVGEWEFNAAVWIGSIED